ncbi:tetratricopeptide repeat protein [Plantactinospora sp. CA-294935]|uniref:tetratricopeptide repeat protein n=1 Tax=Plantactinospora sp. CA-294935 TaxID=3240012 RepID=UPI003D924B32
MINLAGSSNYDMQRSQGLQIGGGQQFNFWFRQDTAEWPIQIGRPPALARSFQPRTEFAEDARITIATHQPLILTQVVAAGGGGVGKTQLAASLFSRARDEEVQVLVWVNASSRESIISTYADAATQVRAGPTQGVSGDQAAGNFLNWLSVTAHPWIVVLDDLVDPVDVKGLWPDGRSGRVIATTRRRDIAPSGAAHVLVDVFTPNLAARYLIDRFEGETANAVHPEVLDEAEELALDLGCLPLALAQAASLIVVLGITCKEYRRRFKNRARHLEELFPLDANADEYSDTVASTWSLSIERANAMAPAGLALPALQIAAFADPNGAPEAIWHTQPVKNYLIGAIGVAQPTNTDIHDALRNLHRLSLIDHTPHDDSATVRTHALIQRAVRESLDQEKFDRLARVFADALAEVWSHASNDTHSSRILRLNATTLTRGSGDALWEPEAHNIFFRTGESMADVGLVGEAIRYWDALALEAKERLGPEHRQTLLARQRTAEAIGAAGDASTAARQLEELFEDCIRILGTRDTQTLSAQHGLAYWRGASGNAAGAARAFEKLVADRRSVLGAQHLETLLARHDLIRWRSISGDASETIEQLIALVQDCSRTLGRDHPATFMARNTLLTWRGILGDPEGAAAEMAELVVDRTRAHGRNHPITLAARHDEIFWRQASGQTAGAAARLEEVLKDYTRVLGPSHPDTLTVINDLSQWYGVEGDAAKAASSFDVLLQACLHILGENHPDTLTTKHNLGLWRGVAGDRTSAISLLTEAVATSTTHLGAAHPDTLASRQALADWRGVSQGAEVAIDDYGVLLEDSIRFLDPRHPHIFSAAHSRADWIGVSGGTDDALRALGSLLEECRANFVPDHPRATIVKAAVEFWRTPETERDFSQLIPPSLRGLSASPADQLATRNVVVSWRPRRVRRRLSR